eukprot:9503440-Pyramimonas_sp.AAC.1
MQFELTPESFISTAFLQGLYFPELPARGRSLAARFRGPDRCDFARRQTYGVMREVFHVVASQ